MPQIYYVVVSPSLILEGPKKPENSSGSFPYRFRVTSMNPLPKRKVHSFLGVFAFLQHGPKRLSGSKMEAFPRNSRLPGTRPEFLDFPKIDKEQVAFSGEDRRDPKMSLALEQPRLAPVQPWGSPRARDNSGTLRPSPKKSTCSFPYQYMGITAH